MKRPAMERNPCRPQCRSATSHEKDTHMKQSSNTTAPTMGQWVLAVTFLGISLGGAAITMHLNWAFGMKTDIYAAIVFAGAEIILFTMPFTKSQLGGWNMRRRAAWAVALLVSLWAAFSHLSEMQSQRANDLRASSGRIVSARAAVEDLRRELSKLTETGEAAALQLEYDALRATVTSEMADGGCKTRCRAARDAATAILPRIGAAKRRDALKVRIDEAEAIAGSSRHAMGATDNLAALMGIETAQLEAYIATGTSAIMLLMLVLASAFSGDAGAMLNQCISSRKASRMAPKPARAEMVRQAVALAAPMSQKDETLLALQALIMNASDKCLVASINDLAVHFQVARSTMKDWAAEWREAGKIAYVTKGNVTKFHLPRAA